MNTPYTITNDNITVIVEGKPYVTPRGNPAFEALCKAALGGDTATLARLASPKLQAQAWAKGDFTLSGDNFSYQGRPIDNRLNNKINAMIQTNSDPNALFLFWERLQKNPSYRSVEQLYKFLEHIGVPLTPDGCFLAYKGVRSDLYDQHSGMNLNAPGQKLSMPRNMISDDPRTPCHEGLHVGALEYAKGFGPRVVICKVDPADVVCVPYDSSHQKMRVAAYEVVGIHGSGDQTLPEGVLDLSKPEASEATSGDPADEYQGHVGLPGLADDEDEFEGDEDEDEEDEEDEDEYGTIEREDHGDGTVTMRSTGNIDLRDVVSLNDAPEDEDEEIPAPVEKKVHAKTVKPLRLPAKWRRLHDFDGGQLLAMSIADLRKYAQALKIVNASKLPGGKHALVQVILDTRRVLFPS